MTSSLQTPNQPLTVAEAIHQRRSVKNFQPRPIPKETLNELVELTLAAPSSWNFQPWRLVLVQSPEQKAALSQASWNQRQIVDAAVTFVFAVSVRGWEKTMEQTLATAALQGAWPAPFVDFIRKNAPGFQKGLGAKEREYAIKDAMIAATHTVLAAESLGLGTCLMNGWDEQAVKTVLGAGNDPDIAIAVVLPVGYAQERPKSPGRLPRETTVFSERIA